MIGIPQISPSATNVNYTNQGFPGRKVMTTINNGSALANFAINDINASKIAVIDDRTAYEERDILRTQFKVLEALTLLNSRMLLSLTLPLY